MREVEGAEWENNDEGKERESEQERGRGGVEATR